MPLLYTNTCNILVKSGHLATTFVFEFEHLFCAMARVTTIGLTPFDANEKK